MSSLITGRILSPTKLMTRRVQFGKLCSFRDQRAKLRKTQQTCGMSINKEDFHSRKIPLTGYILYYTEIDIFVYRRMKN